MPDGSPHLGGGNWSATPDRCRPIPTTTTSSPRRRGARGSRRRSGCRTRRILRPGHRGPRWRVDGASGATGGAERAQAWAFTGVAGPSGLIRDRRESRLPQIPVRRCISAARPCDGTAAQPIGLSQASPSRGDLCLGPLRLSTASSRRMTCVDSSARRSTSSSWQMSAVRSPDWFATRATRHRCLAS